MVIGIRAFPFPGAADLAKAFEGETKQTSSQHIADTYAAAQVLLDAIAAAGSTNAEKINAAIAKTDKTYVVGPGEVRRKPHRQASDGRDAVAEQQAGHRLAEGAGHRHFLVSCPLIEAGQALGGRA